MRPSRQYRNAPITEALIDIEVELTHGANLELLEGVYRAVASQYPIRGQRSKVEATISTGDALATSAKSTPLGLILRNESNTQVFQARRDGFTFSRLKPYQGWEPLRDEARALWEIYGHELKPLRMTRVAVRYINQIDIPPPLGDLNKYFRTFPEVSPELPQLLSGYLMQLIFDEPAFGGTAILTQMLAPPVKPGFASVVLDIDVFKTEANLKSDDAWDLIEKLRLRKNELFEGCITDYTRSLFD